MKAVLPAGWGGTYREPKAAIVNRERHNAGYRRVKPRRAVVARYEVPYDGRLRSKLGLFICGRWYDL